MRLSTGQASVGGGTNWGNTGYEIHGRGRRRVTLALSVVIVLGCVGLLFTTTAKPAAAAGSSAPVQFATGQVFASVGQSNVKVYSQANPTANPPTSAGLITTLNDGLNETYTAGTAFDAQGNLYVADDYSGDVSKYLPNGTLVGVFASGLDYPISLAFDNLGNLYVGQQGTPYIAEFSPSGTLVRNIGPLATELTGDDWIALADQCNIYYTTEGTDILHYNMCTNPSTGQDYGQQPNFNVTPFPATDPTYGYPNGAYELQVLGNGDVLVADTSADILLDPAGNVLHTYTCGSLSSTECGNDSLFAISLDPSGTSFWTADSTSGDIYQVALGGANDGQLLQTISTHLTNLFGLTVDGQIEVAAPTPSAQPVPTSLAVQPVTGNFTAPTQVSAVLMTNPPSGTDTPIVNEPVTFYLNGTIYCTGTTIAGGIATCTGAPDAGAGTYTLTATFGGDSTTSTPLGTQTATSTFTATQAPTTLTYTGPTTAVNGQTITLTANLTTNPTNTPNGNIPLPTKAVTFTIGSQTCGPVQTDVNGMASCQITVDQPTTAVTVTTSFNANNADTNYQASSTTTPLTVTEPTTLTLVSPPAGDGEYSDATTVSGVLKDPLTNLPIANEPVLFTLNNNEQCSGVTDSTGTASCPITPGEPQGTYTLTASFPGDPKLPLQLAPAPTSSAPFNVALEETSLALNGSPYSVINTQNLTVSATLTTNTETAPIAATVPVVGRSLTFVLGTGATAQTCTTAAPGTNATGTGTCTISNVSQAVGPMPITVSFTSDGYYQGNNAAGTANVGPVQTGTTLSVTNTTGDYNDATTVQATLIDNYTSLPAANEPVTITLNGTQSCGPVMTNSSGVASCQITPNEKAGSYPLTASFVGDTSVLPHLEPSTGSGTFVVTPEQAFLSYTGPTTAVNGSSATLSGVLTTDDPALGAPISGRTVTFTLGSGSSAQICSGMTNSTGAVSCIINKVNQATSPVKVTDNFTGDAYFLPASASGSVTIDTPTTLSVSAGTGTYGQSTTLTGTLTNSVTGAPISGQTVTLTLNGTQSCTAVTNSMGHASCSVTPNEPAATYSVSGSFGGSTSTTVLLPSSGHNCFVVNPAPTTLTYTGPTQVFQGGTITLTSTLTSNGAPVPGQSVVMTLGTGRTAETCTVTTNSSGVTTCTITVNQIPGSLSVTVSYAGSSWYQSSSTVSGEQIGCGGGGGQGGGGQGGGGGTPCGNSGGGGQGGGCRPPCGSYGCGGGGGSGSGGLYCG